MWVRMQIIVILFLSATALAEPAKEIEVQGPQPKSQLAVELLDAHAEYERQRDLLYAELLELGESARRVELQKQLEQLKRRAELRLIEIQLEHARARGELELAAKLEAILVATETSASEARQ